MPISELAQMVLNSCKLMLTEEIQIIYLNSQSVNQVIYVKTPQRFSEVFLL
jgi:hypothetical protein